MCVIRSLFVYEPEFDFIRNIKKRILLFLVFPAINFQVYHDRFKGTSKEGTLVTTAALAKGTQYGYTFTVTKKVKEGGEARNQTVMVPLSEWQILVLEQLFKSAISLEGGFYND